MSNINHTNLSCNDIESLDRIMAEKWEAVLSEWYEVNCSPGKPVTITSNYRTPWREIAQISEENPALLFTAEFSSSPEYSAVIRVVEFKKGIFNEVTQRPNYSVAFYPPQAYIGKPFYYLMERAEKIFERMDTVLGARGTMEADIITYPILVTLEDGEYMIKVLKQGFKVEVAECLKRRPGVPGKWTEIEKELKGNLSI